MILVFFYMHIYIKKLEVMKMKVQRQDAWSEQEDVQLAHIVLSYIESGNTQLKAFEEAAEKLKRTPAACGFRWNAFLRKQYEEQIKRIKSQKSVHEPIELPVGYDYSQITAQLKNMITTFDQLNVELNQLNEELLKIKDENEQLKVIKKEYIELLTLIKKIKLEPNRSVKH